MVLALDAFVEFDHDATALHVALHLHVVFIFFAKKYNFLDNNLGHLNLCVHLPEGLYFDLFEILDEVLIFIGERGNDGLILASFLQCLNVLFD